MLCIDIIGLNSQEVQEGTNIIFLLITAISRMFKLEDEDEEKCKCCQKYNENYNYYVVKSILIELSLAY